MAESEPTPTEASASLPAPMAERHRAWRCSEVWRNHVVTWRLEHDDGSVRYLKVGPRHWWPGLGAEVARMRWARGHLPVPEVLAFGQDADVEWLLTAALPGTRVFNEELHHRPEVLVPLLARSLRRFHEAPRRSCPFDFTIATALAQIRERLERGLFDRKGKLDPKYHRVTTAEAAMEELERTRPAEEDLVVCHGDYCPPNVLVADDQVVGFVDLCDLGIADRWLDIAIAPWGLEAAGLGPEWEDQFYRSYGVAPDPDRFAFYRLLYDLKRLLMSVP